MKQGEPTLLPVARQSPLTKIKLGQSFVVMSVGLAVDGQPSLDEWLEAGRLLNKAEGALRWWRGDWLNYGEEVYGQTYKKAMEETGLAYKTLRNEKYVANQVELSLRRDNLSWTHHQLVAPLEPDQQRYWLDFAVEHQLKASELRDKIKGARRLSWLRYNDVWNFSECDERYGSPDFPGRIPGQIVQNVLYYYTNEGDYIIDPMAGGGTTLDVCTKCEDIRRDCLCFSKPPKRDDILEADATNVWPAIKPANLVFIDPPYWSQQDEIYSGMAAQTLENFLTDMRSTMKQAHKNLIDNGVLAVLIAPMAIKAEYIDLPFVFYEMAKALGFHLKRRIQVPVGSQQVGPAIQKYHKDNHSMIALARDLLIMQKEGK